MGNNGIRKCTAAISESRIGDLANMLMSPEFATRNKGCSIDRRCTFGPSLSVLSFEPGLDGEGTWRVFHDEDSVL